MEKDSYYRKLKTKELIEIIIKEYHRPLRLGNPMIKKDLIYLCKKYRHIETKLLLIKELFEQFDSQIIKHIDREEKVFFKAIIDLEEKVINLKDIDKKTIKDVKAFIKKQEIEHSEIDNYTESIEILCSKISKISDPIFYDFIRRIRKLINETDAHVKIEDFYLNEKANYYLNLI